MAKAPGDLTGLVRRKAGALLSQAAAGRTKVDGGARMRVVADIS